jgi:hypothetical protein
MLPISTARKTKAVFITQSHNPPYLEILDLGDDSRLDLYQLIRDFPRVRAAAGSPSVRVDEVIQ